MSGKPVGQILDGLGCVSSLRDDDLVAGAEDAAVLTRKGARWRALEPTQGQINAAVRWRLPVLATRGEMSDALSEATASVRLDGMPCVASVTEGSYW